MIYTGEKRGPGGQTGTRGVRTAKRLQGSAVHVNNISTERLSVACGRLTAMDSANLRSTRRP